MQSLALYAILITVGNLAGGALLTYTSLRNYNRRFLKYLIGMGAGFMLAAALLEVVPESINLMETQGFASGPQVVLGLVLAGYLLIQLAEHTLAPHFHFGEETHAAALISARATYAAIGGLATHSFFDGVSVSAATVTSQSTGFLVFIAILLHKLPEGFTAASIILASGRSRKQAQWATFLIGGASLLGVVAVVILGRILSPVVVYALPVSAGVTLYVAASDLIPEVNHEEKDPFVAVVVFVGVALFWLLRQALVLGGVHG